MKRRHAFTLIETLVSMTVGGTLMTLALALLQQSMALSSTAKRVAYEDSTANRLVDQFRFDVGVAEEVTIQSPDTVSLGGESGEVVYVVANGRITSERTSKSEWASENDKTRREVFSLGPLCDVKFEMHKQPDRATLTLSRRSELKQVAPRVWRQASAIVGCLRVDVHQEASR